MQYEYRIVQVLARASTFALTTLAGSTFADRTNRALQLIGQMELEDFAKDHPEDALRVFIKKNRRPYTDESPVGTILVPLPTWHAERILYEVLFHAISNIVKPFKPLFMFSWCVSANLGVCACLKLVLIEVVF